MLVENEKYYYCIKYDKTVKLVSWNDTFPMCIIELNGILLPVLKNNLIKSDENKTKT